MVWDLRSRGSRPGIPNVVWRRPGDSPSRLVTGTEASEGYCPSQKKNREQIHYLMFSSTLRDIWIFVWRI